MEKKDILIIIILFFIAFFVREAGVSNPNVFIYRDEIRYWFRALRILAFNFAPPAEIIQGYPSPFLPYIMAVIAKFFGGDLNTLRMISVVFGSLTVTMLYLFGKAMYDRKTGLLSALFLCFSAYHVLFSHTIMLEAFTIFFTTAFLYFFWLSQRSNDTKSTTYAIIAGAMMGLAIAAKYLPIFLIPVVFAYVLWTKGFVFKALLDKRVILTLIFALLFFSPIPLWWFYSGLGLDPIYYATIGKYEKGLQMMELPEVSRSMDFPISELLISGVEKITEMLSWGAKTLNPFWTALFELSAILLLMITLFSYLPDFMNREKKASFCMVSILTLCMFLVVHQPSRYYVMYILPLYFVMLSHLIVKSFEHLRIENNYMNIFRTFIISLAAIMLFFSFFTTVTLPCWGESNSAWIKDSVDYIRSDISKSGYEGNVLIGCTDPDVDYYIYLSGLNATTIPSLKPAGKYDVTVEFKNVNKLKPNYIIMHENEHDYLFHKTRHTEIFKDYSVVFYSKSHYFLDGFVLKRKDIQQSKPKEILYAHDKDGKIFQDIFNSSIPSVMKVGEVCTALVKVENTGDSNEDFTVRVYSEKFIIFVEDKPLWRKVNLDKGSSRIFKFNIVPIRDYVGVLPITVDLYVKYEDGTYRKVDSSIDYVHLIKK